MADVFISYSRKNTAFARRLIEKLNHSGKNSWVDWEGIPLISPNWWDEIKQGIDGADSFLFITSPDSMASVVCNMELEYAIQLGKRIIPLIYQDVETEAAFATIADFTADDAMNERLNGKHPLKIAQSNWQNLSHINWIHFRESDDFEESYQKLINAVDTNLDYVRAHTRYLVRAQEWAKAGRREDLLLFGSEIDRAEAWLKQSDVYRSQKRTHNNPPALKGHRLYITTSRAEDDRRRRVLRNLRVGTWIFASVGVIAFGIAVISWFSSQEAERRESVAVSAVALAEVELTAIPVTLTPIGGTLQAGATQIVQQEIDSQATLGVIHTEVAFAQATVTQISIMEGVLVAFNNAMLSPNNPTLQIAQMNSMVDQYGQESQAWTSRGAIYASHGDYINAVHDYTQALILDPNNPFALTYRGVAYRELGENEKALEDFNQVIALDPQHPNVYNEIGLVYKAHGKYEEALVAFEEALNQDPESDIVFINRGNTYRIMNNYTQALDDLNKGIAINPNNPRYFDYRAVVHYAMNDLDSALDDFTKAIALDLNSTESYYNRAIIYHLRGEVGKAANDLSQALALNPNYLDAHIRLGSVHLDIGNYPGAIGNYSRAIELDPQSAISYSNRGLAYFRLEDYQEALNNYNQALAIDPNLPSALERRGHLYLLLAPQDPSITNYMIIENYTRYFDAGGIIPEQIQITLRQSYNFDLNSIPQTTGDN